MLVNAFKVGIGWVGLISFVKNNDSNIEAGLQIVKVIYDAPHEAIENNEIASDVHDYHQEVQIFINAQLAFSRQAKDHSLMTTPDANGRLPLHNLLRDNVILGSIKLFATSNTAAIQTPDKSGALPLHVACEHHESSSVVSYLLGLDMNTFHSVDNEGNTALHYACRNAQYDSISLLLRKYDAASVSKKNVHKKLPIDLLWESSVVDRDSIKYIESCFCLLRVRPEIVMNSGMDAVRKKRKFSKM